MDRRNLDYFFAFKDSKSADAMTPYNVTNITAVQNELAQKTQQLEDLAMDLKVLIEKIEE